VIVELGLPFAVGEDYACPYRITYGSTNVLQKVYGTDHMEIYGVDALSALQFALTAIASTLRHAGPALDGVYWLEPGDDLGLPEPKVMQ